MYSDSCWRTGISSNGERSYSCSSMEQVYGNVEGQMRIFHQARHPFQLPGGSYFRPAGLELLLVWLYVGWCVKHTKNFCILIIFIMGVVYFN